MLRDYYDVITRNFWRNNFLQAYIIFRFNHAVGHHLHSYLLTFESASSLSLSPLSLSPMPPLSSPQKPRSTDHDGRSHPRPHSSQNMHCKPPTAMNPLLTHRSTIRGSLKVRFYVLTAICNTKYAQLLAHLRRVVSTVTQRRLSGLSQPDTTTTNAPNPPDTLSARSERSVRVRSH